jgi:hypothetical protein
MAIDEKRLRSLINKAESFTGPAPYAGVSWRDLERYNRYEEPASGFVMTAEDMPLTQLYAGLAVLSRDIHLYLGKSARKDAAFFRDIVNAVNAEERKRYGATAFPYDDPNFPYKAELKSFPKELTLKAIRGKPTLAPLGNNAIRHEWTVKAGKKLLLEFLSKAGPKFKGEICGADGLKVESDERKLTIEIAKLALVSIGITAALWYPLAACLAEILVKRGLNLYCESKG